MNINENNRKRIKRAAISWLCVAVLASAAIPAELAGIVTPFSVSAADSSDASVLTGTIDLSRLMEYKADSSLCPAGVTAELAGNSSNEYDRSVVLTITQSGTYKLVGNNCINGSYVDVQIKADNNAKVNIVCDDAFIKNDNGNGYYLVCGSGIECRNYVIPFKAENGSEITASGKLYIDLYSWYNDDYGAYYAGSECTEGNVVLNKFNVYCHFGGNNDYDENYALSGYDYDLRDYYNGYKCLSDRNSSGTGITTVNSDANINFCVEHNYDSNDICTRCGDGMRTVTIENGSGSQTASVKDGELLTKPSDPTNGNKTFTGWYADKACTELYDFSKPVTGDITLYAGWFAPVVFDGVTYDKPLNRNTIKYFYTDASGNISLDTGNYILAEDLTDIAVDMKSGSDVKLFLNGFKLAADLDTSAASEFTLADDKTNRGTLLIKNNSTDNWKFPVDLTVGENTDTATKAKYPYALCHTRVDFEMNGHGTAIASAEPENNAVAKPADPTESGWTFGGWYSDAALTTPFDFDNVSDICTAYAKWTEYGLEEITISTLPQKTEYTAGEKFDPTGLVITAAYDNGETKDIAYSSANASEFKFSPDGILSASDTAVTVTYGGRSADVAVTVSGGKTNIEPSEGNAGSIIDMSPDKLGGSVFDDYDRKLIEQGIDISVCLSMSLIDIQNVSEADRAAIDKVLGDFTLGCYFDVELFRKYSNGAPDRQITDTSSPIVISFDIPQFIIDNYPDDEYLYALFCSHNGIGYNVMSTYDADNDRMSFSSDKFSVYALGVKSRQPKHSISADGFVTIDSSAKPGDTVTVTVEDGYRAIISDADGNVIAVITGTGTFTMPDSDVTVTAQKITPAITYYSVSADRFVTVDDTKHKAGDTVTVTVEDGYRAVVSDTDGNVIAVITGTGIFTMPDSDVTVTAQKIIPAITYYSVSADRFVTVYGTKHKAGDKVNYRVAELYEADIYANGRLYGRISGSGTFTMPAADVRIVSKLNETAYAALTSTVENSYVFAYDADMNLIKTNSTRKKNDYIIIDLGEEYSGRAFTVYTGRKSKNTAVTEGVLDANGRFTFENAGFGKNYTLVVE